MLDLNRTVLKEQRANEAINAVVDAAQISAMRQELARPYLGASAVGHECLRKIHWDWRFPRQVEPRTERIFARGRWFEDYAVKLLTEGGFRVVRNSERIAFTQLEGRFKGHGDGMPIAGPVIDGIGFPCLWECKGLGTKGWNKLNKEGLAKAYPTYADQVALYQAYFDLTEFPAIFTAGNMDTMEVLHLLIPFDPQRAQAASDRAVQIIAADAAGETLPRVSDTPENWRCRFCGHKDRCWA